MGHRATGQRRWVIGSMIALIILGGALIAGATMLAAQAPAASAAQTLPGCDTTVNIAIPAPNPKQSLCDAEQTRVAQAMAQATAHPNNAVGRGQVPQSLQAVPTAPQPTGIINRQFPGPNPGVVTITNKWQDSINSRLVTVWAGALTADPQQGVVVVIDGPIAAMSPPPQPRTTPTKHGAVRVTAVNGPLLTLTAIDGTIFTFDRTTEAFR